MVARNILGRQVELMRLGGTVEIVAFSGTSAQSSAITVPSELGSPGNAGQIVELLADQDCHIAVGSNPTATTSSHKLKANIPYRFTIASGYRIAVIQNTTGGNLQIVQNG